MTSEKLMGEEPLNMLKEKGNICISIIVPTHRLSPERRADQSAVESAVANAKQMLKFKYSESNTAPLLQEIDKLYEAIDYVHNADGIGLYVSQNTSMAVRFPFPVEEKVLVADHFELRDILYKATYSKHYFVLLLTQNVIRLFKGEWDELEEIKDSHFPLEHEEEYLYNPSSRSTSVAGHAQLKGVEREKSELEEIRFKDFFRHADDLLKEHLVNRNPLVLLGTAEEMEWFESITMYKEQIIHKIAGSYNYSNLADLAEMVWPAVHSWLDEQNKELIKEFKEKIGEKRGVWGIQAVWQAAKEGRAFKLLVEKDYRVPGFVESDGAMLHLRPPLPPHHAIPDAVNDVIEMMLEKNGQVFFMDNDMLGDYQKIALITRY